MTESDGTSFWDWCEPEEFTLVRRYETFEHALAFAREMVTVDVFGMTRITRQRYVRNLDDLGNIRPGSSWESEVLWEVDADSPVDEAAPDVSVEAA